jgi:hypothetical protein
MVHRGIRTSTDGQFQISTFAPLRPSDSHLKPVHDRAWESFRHNVRSHPRCCDEGVVRGHSAGAEVQSHYVKMSRNRISAKSHSWISAIQRV